MYPVCFGIFILKLVITENGSCKTLRGAIGSPRGLSISTDAGQAGSKVLLRIKGLKGSTNVASVNSMAIIGLHARRETLMTLLLQWK
jgi:hypothetical protein